MWPFNNPSIKNQTGVTLVELIIAIVIISIAAVALLQGMGLQTIRNVDPMMQSQAQALARQYLEEVLSKPFFDPAGDPRLLPTITQAQATAAIVDNNESTADPTNRIGWNNIWEYKGLSDIPRDINGTTISELQSFTVNIDVDNSTNVQLGSLNNSVSCPAKVLLITVTVTDPRGQKLTLDGYRASYFDASDWGC